jgi:hypothetical protein
MKTLFAMAAVAAVATLSLTAIDSADARGGRGGGGGISTSSIQTGPRVTTPVINPNRVGPQVRPIRGPREGGRGINCGPTGRTQMTIINPRTGASETVTMANGPTRCTTRY